MRKERSWVLLERSQKQLLQGKKTVEDLADDDFVPGLRQKAVDMRIGLDIASITLKKQADTIILVSGDADFVPAAKLARREGVKIVLDPLWRSVADDLYEHIDGIKSGFPKPKRKED
ncbi:NYN domain-containing protein [Cognatiyoonia sediminum]|uniref:NYN domain-containing protein n=1 Tax=Cognatiyoonia sediminum TaxID=1508389 RepID=UPI001A963519|nr:NYN domain-containing protein [Cognatiyoonia sediminum]